MKLALLLVPAFAAADVRVEAHAGGGMEGGLISGEPHPETVSEIGGGVAVLRETWGVGFVVERVGRLSSDLPRDRELKLDVMAFLRAKRFVAGIGAGVRRLEVAGAPDRPGSTLWGLDLMRMQMSGKVARLGPVALELYFAWTFGIYKGEVYGPRAGDMAYPVRDYSNVASSYVLGVSASFESLDL